MSRDSSYFCSQPKLQPSFSKLIQMMLPESPEGHVLKFSRSRLLKGMATYRVRLHKTARVKKLTKFLTKGAESSLFRPHQFLSMRAWSVWSCQENPAEKMQDE
jgi:hypothetical protein